MTQGSGITPFCKTSYSLKKGYVTITLLEVDRASEGLRFRFVSGLGIGHSTDPRFLEATSILAKCTHFTPIGFKVINGSTLRVEYEKVHPNLLERKRGRAAAHDDIAHSATRLRERIDETCAELNSRFKTDPKSLIVSPRD